MNEANSVAEAKTIERDANRKAAIARQGAASRALDDALAEWSKENG